MSRAVPASYSEYLFTTAESGLICDGGIMPLRNSTDPTSTWYRKCLRAEDLTFFNEALKLRSRCYGSGTDRTTTKQISKSRIWEFKDSVSTMTSGFSPRRPNVVAYDLGDGSIWDYVRSCYYPVTQYSATDTYTVLDSAQIMNLYKDIKQLNYTFDNGGRGSCVPYRYSESCTLQRTEYYHDGTTETSQNTYSGYVWYDYEYYIWDKDEGYSGDIDYSVKETPISSTWAFTEQTSNPPNLYKKCVEIIPCALMEVGNSGSTYGSNSS